MSIIAPPLTQGLGIKKFGDVRNLQRNQTLLCEIIFLQDYNTHGYEISHVKSLYQALHYSYYIQLYSVS